ncbi:MAG: arabinose ABC transporter substrate-binding protein [bacterium]
MKMTGLISGVCAVTFLLAGCGKPAATTANTGTPDKNAVTIGFLVKQPDEPWFRNEWKFAQQAADKYGFKLVKIGTQDGEKVLAAIDNLAALGAKGFIICTPNVRLGPAIAARAKACNMKLMTVDDRFVGTGDAFMDVPHMGISAGKIGNAVGEALWEEMQRRGWKMEDTSAMGITQKQLETARERTDGATETLLAKGFPKDRVYIGPLPDKSEVSTAFDAANVLLTQHQGVKNWLVFGMNDESVLGGVRALEGRGYTADNVIGVGIGGSTGMVDWKKEKPTGFYAALLISPKRHGFETAELMYKWITEGVEPPKLTLTSGILIRRDDYQKIMTEQGLL